MTRMVNGGPLIRRECKRIDNLIHLLRNAVIRQPFLCQRRAGEDHHGLISLHEVALSTKLTRGELDPVSESHSDGHDDDWCNEGYSWGRSELEREVVVKEMGERLESTAR
jgi:hypothetical protein